MPLKLVKNEEWITFEINGESVDIPKNWSATTVGQVTTCLDSKRKPLNSTARSSMAGTYPYWGAANIVDYVNDYLIDEEVVLLGEDAAPFFDKSKRVAFLISEKIWPNNHIHVLRPEHIEGAFLAYALNKVNYEKIIGVSARPKLTQAMMNEILLAMPPRLEEQALISSLLSQQDQVVADLSTLVTKLETRFRYFSEELLSGRLRVKEVDGKPVLYKNEAWKEVEVNGETVGIPEDWAVAELAALEDLGDLELFRGRVISKAMLSPSGNPVYSSSVTNNGLFGYTTDFDFDEELVTWSVDGGGDFFYRQKHKMSITNVAGGMRISNPEKLSVRFVYYVLSRQHRTQTYNYVDKAHPSVIRNRYFVPTLPRNEQNLIVEILSRMETDISQHNELLKTEKQKFQWLLENLMTGKYLLKEE